MIGATSYLTRSFRGFSSCFACFPASNKPQTQDMSGATFLICAFFCGWVWVSEALTARHVGSYVSDLVILGAAKTVTIRNVGGYAYSFGGLPGLHINRNKKCRRLVLSEP